MKTSEISETDPVPDAKSALTQVSFLSDDEIRALLKKYKVRPTKKHGQSFLKSQQVARNIVSAAEITKEDSILEVGGGLGILTKQLVQEAGHVHVIELDSGLVKALQETLAACENITIIEGDALKVPLPNVTKIVSNLPYSISSEITFRMLRELEFEEAILMYQKEFAQRLHAIPGTAEYSRLSVNIGYQAEVEHLMDVPADRFYPVPAVDSVVVRLKKSTQIPRAKSDDVFFWMIKGIFSYPNKHLRKAMRIWFRNLKVDKKLADVVLENCEGSPKEDNRLRTISIETLVQLADCLLTLVDEGKLPDPRGN
ncbi:MAG: 16S rRNA (adenine(1518)-N(6)/adenine(1519)-N(6))-dimethyltransferase RsmA [Candidatus Thorarchaeota archaeon]